MAPADDDRSNRLRARFAAGVKSFGGWCVTPSTFAVEVLAAEGFDYVCIDCQHGLIHYDTMWPMLQALRWSDSTPLVRVPYNSTPWPGKALDAGAEGVIVPMINTSAAAAQAVAACRYPPDGVRSFGPVRAGMLLGQDPEACNREVLCLVMIETVEAVENADSICATPGVDGVYIGPADLAISMGVPLDRMFDDKSHADAVDEVRRACARHDRIAGIHTGGGAQASALAQAGFDMCTLATDAVFLRRAARNELAVARGETSTGSQGPYG